MFKSLKKKIEQGVQNTPLRNAAAAISKSDDQVTDDIGSPVAESTPIKTPERATIPLTGSGDSHDAVSSPISQSDGDTPTGQLVDIPLETSNDTHYQTATDFGSLVGDETPKVSRSRTSSISSVTSDSSFYQHVSFNQHHYTLPSDIESEVDESSVSLDSISKEDLYLYVKKYERRALKYKSKFMELMTIYKDMAQERDKFKTTLTQSQDKAFRRISELKEQIQLDLQAKKDLEDNYRLMLDEKEEFVKVLNMQVKLLKEGKAIPPELQEKLSPNKAVTTETAPPGGGKEEITVLREKMRRLEVLLNRCKDTIRSSKEKNLQLAEEKENLQRQLEDSNKNIEKLKNTPDISKLQNQIEKAKHVIVQLETDRELTIAEVKKQVHEEIEKKDGEVREVRGELHQANEKLSSMKMENTELQIKVDKLNKSGEEHLEKSREIFAKMKEEKRELTEKFELMDKNMDEEKSKLIQELSRGKAAAMALIQEDIERKLEEKIRTTVIERDEFWKSQLEQQEKLHGDVTDAKEKDTQLVIYQLQEESHRKISETSENSKLELEEQELQKMAAMSEVEKQKEQLSREIDKLLQEKDELLQRVKLTEENHVKAENKLTETVLQLQTQHSEEMHKLSTSQTEQFQLFKSETDKAYQEKVEALISKHCDDVESIQIKYEESLQGSNSQVEEFYKSQFDSVKANLEELLAERKSKIEDLEKQISQLTSDIARKNEEMQQLKTENDDQVSNFYSKMSTKDTTIENLKDTIGALETKKQEFEEENLKLKEDLENEKLRFEDFVQEKADISQQLEMMKSQCDEQLEISSGESAEKSVLVAQLERKDSQIILLQNEFEALKHEKTQVEEESIQKEATRTQHAQSLAEAEAEIYSKLQRAESQVTDFETRIRELNDQVKKEKGEKDELQREKLEITESLNQREKEKADITESLKQKQKYVATLEETIKSLEDCQKSIVTEKVDLEEKFTNLERILEDLQQTKSELSQKLNESTETLTKTATLEKEEFGLRINHLESDLVQHVEQNETLQKSVATKDDEIFALRTLIEENSGLITSLEGKVSTLEEDLKNKTLDLEDKEAKLNEAVDKFTKLRNEAKSKIKDLKDKVEKLTTNHKEETEMRQKDFDNKMADHKAEKETVETSVDDFKKNHQAAMASLESRFEEQFSQKQEKYKENMMKIKDRFDEKLKEKDADFDNKLQEMLKQKDLGIGDITKNLEVLKEQQMAEQAEWHQATLKEKEMEWEMKSKESEEMSMKTLGNKETEISELKEQHQKHVVEMTEKHGAKLKEIESINTRLSELKDEVIEKNNILAEKEQHLVECGQQIEILNTEIINVRDKNTELSALLESTQKNLLIQQEGIETETNNKLANLEITVSELTNELTSVTEKHETELQEKDAKIQETMQRVVELENKSSSVEEVLKAVNDSSQTKDDDIQMLKDECSNVEERAKNLEVRLIEREEELKNILNQLDTSRSQRDALVIQVQEEQEVMMQKIRNDYDMRMIEMQSSDNELQTKLKELNDKLTAAEEKMQDCIHSYENQIEDYKNKIERNELTQKEEMKQLSQQLDDSRNELSSVSDMHQTVADKDCLLEEVTRKHSENLATQEESWQNKIQDLKKKYVAKFKSYQIETEAKIQQTSTEKATMSQDLANVNTKLMQMEETEKLVCQELENKFQQSQTSIMEKDAQIQTLQNTMTEGLEQINRLRQTLSEKDSEIIEKVSLVQNNSQNIQKYEARITDLEYELKSVNTENSRFVGELKTSQVDLSEHESRVSKLTNELQNSNSQNTEIKYELEKSNSNISELESELQTSKVKQSGLESVDSELAEYKTHLEMANIKLTELKVELDKVQTSFHESLANETQLKNSLSEVEEKKTQVLADLTMKLESESTVKQVEYKKKAEQYIAQIKKQLQVDMEAILLEQKQQITELESTITERNNRISDLEKRIDLLTNEKSDLENSLRNETSEIESHLSENLKSKDTLQESFHKIESLQTLVSDSEHKYESLESERDLLLTESQNLQLDIVKLKHENNEFVQSLKSVKHDLESLKTDKDREYELITRENCLVIENLNKNHEKTLEDIKHEHDSKIKHLVREMNLTLAEKEKTFEDTISEAAGKSERDEDRLFLEHKQQMDELWKDVNEKDKRLENIYEEHHQLMQEKEVKYEAQLTRLQDQLTKQKQHHQIDLYDQEERFKKVHQASLKFHEVEVSALTQEWNQERKSADQITHIQFDPLLKQEVMVEQNQRTLSAMQTATPGGGESMRQEIVGLTQELEDVKTKHRLEIAELQSQVQMSGTKLQKPIPPQLIKHQIDVNDPSAAEEVQNLEFHNMDLQAHVCQLNGELTQMKQRESDFHNKIKMLEHKLIHPSSPEPPLSPGSHSLHDLSLMSEPTEIEYLRNILYEYMMGKETKTLAKVISTVVNFNDEQKRNVIAREESKIHN